MKCQALVIREEREERRKRKLPEDFRLGRAVKSRTTVIVRWGAIDHCIILM